MTSFCGHDYINSECAKHDIFSNPNIFELFMKYPSMLTAYWQHTNRLSSTQLRALTINRLLSIKSIAQAY